MASSGFAWLCLASGGFLASSLRMRGWSLQSSTDGPGNGAAWCLCTRNPTCWLRYEVRSQRLILMPSYILRSTCPRQDQQARVRSAGCSLTFRSELRRSSMSLQFFVDFHVFTSSTYYPSLHRRSQAARQYCINGRPAGSGQRSAVSGQRSAVSGQASRKPATVAAWGGAVRCRKILASLAFNPGLANLPTRHTAPLRLWLLCPVLQSAIEKPLPSRLSTSWLPHTRVAQSEAHCRQESRQASLASVGCAAPALTLGITVCHSRQHDNTTTRRHDDTARRLAQLLMPIPRYAVQPYSAR